MLFSLTSSALIVWLPPYGLALVLLFVPFCEPDCEFEFVDDELDWSELIGDPVGTVTCA